MIEWQSFPWVSALGVVACFFGSCFFSGTETALTSLSAAEVERLSSGGGFWNRSLKHWISYPNRLLATNLLGNTLVNTAAAVITANLVDKVMPFSDEYQGLISAGVTLVITILILVFGEIAPKMVARTYAPVLAPYCCRILIILNSIVYPVSWSVTRGVIWSLQSMGLVMPNQRHVSSSDIERMVLMARRQGVMAGDKSKILSSVFQFSKRRVKDIMIAKEDIVALSVDANLLEVLDVVRQENHSRYPVYKGSLDRIIGFLHARDLFGVLRSYGFAEGEPPDIENFSLRTCLRRAFFVSEQSMISKVLNEMKSKRIHLAIVKDEWGNVVGLVTLEDILEEVFGEIEDEHDERSEKPIVDLFEVGVEVEGDTPIGELRSKYELDIEPSESYTTVNGFLQHYASHQQLTAKTVVIWRNYVFTVLDISEGEVQRVRITQIPDDGNDD